MKAKVLSVIEKGGNEHTILGKTAVVEDYVQSSVKIEPPSEEWVKVS